jgi:UDP-glucuronate 4-epimerase
MVINNPSPYNSPVNLMEFIENALDKEATKNFMDIQPGDVESTFADVSLKHC